MNGKMKKKYCVAAICVLFSATFCFSASKKEPEWFKNYRAVYPNAEYLAQRGSGATAESARTDAAAQLARYFATTVNANFSTTMSSITSSSSIQEETRVIDQVEVSSEVDFIGLEFTESYYYKAEKKWYAVAYMNREDAWQQYRPKIEAEKTKFYGFYRKAESEPDSFTKIGLYKSAWKASADFMEKLEYGRIINPKEEEKYSADRDVVAEIPSVIEREQKNLTLQVLLTGDYGDSIGTAVTSAFEKGGFIIGASGNYIATITVNANPSGEDPISVVPSVKVTVADKTGRAVYSYEAKSSEKTVAYTLENAQKKAFPKLAEQITKELTF